MPKVSVCTRVTHLAAVLTLGLTSGTAWSQSAVAPRQYTIDIPLIDAPFNAKTGWAYPSMTQSVAVTKTFYDVIHATVEDQLKFSPRSPGWPGFWKRLAYVGADMLVLMLIPPGEAWLHEEYHRAVMAHRGIASFNDVYRFKLSGSVINVSHESDADLTRLKEEHPEDQVRLAEAGMEAEHMLLQNMQSEAFFLQNTPFHWGIYASVDSSVIGYLGTCNSKEADTITEESNTKEGTSVSARDFIGLDCNGWIRDLNRPDEPYAERGVHPSGVGIDRYTTYSELSEEEKR